MPVQVSTHLDLEFNISNLKPVHWNPYWPPPIIEDPQLEPSVYWQDSQDPYDFDEDMNAKDFFH